MSLPGCPFDPPQVIFSPLFLLGNPLDGPYVQEPSFCGNQKLITPSICSNKDPILPSLLYLLQFYSSLSLLQNLLAKPNPYY
eukprot:9708780-Karenia_brevis.AAC.1